MKFSIRQMFAIVFLISVFLSIFSWLHHSVFVQDYYKAAFAGMLLSTPLPDNDFIEKMESDSDTKIKAGTYDEISKTRDLGQGLFFIIGFAIGVALDILLIMCSVQIFFFLYEHN